LRVPEALFRPSLAGLDVDGLHKLVYNSVLKCDSDLHRELCGNIVLSGGGMMFPGISDRLHSELIKFFPWVMGWIVLVDSPLAFIALSLYLLQLFADLYRE
ncbi:actin, partial [Serendipita sp. 396]